MKNLFLYGLIFSVLFNIFQYVNSTKILDAKDKEVTKIQERLRTSRDSVSALATANYFSLESDEDAQEYFYKNSLDYQKVAEKVKEDLLVLNENKNGNKLNDHTQSAMVVIDNKTGKVVGCMGGLGDDVD